MRESYQVWLEEVEQSEKEDRERWEEYERTRDRRSMPAPKSRNVISMPIPPFKSIGLIGTFNLAMLMDFQRKKRPEAEADEAGWFACTILDMREHFGNSSLSDGQQTRLLNKLERHEYIQRKIVGMPPTRMLWIDFDRITEEHHKNQCRETRRQKVT